MPYDRIDGEIIFDIDMNALEAALHGTGWNTGWSCTGNGSTLSIDVAEGNGFSLGALKSTTGSTNKTLTAADPTNPRKDLIVYDVSASALAVVTGVAEAIAPAGETNPRKLTAPKPPDMIDSADIIIAVIYVPAGATLGSSCTIIDKRVKAVVAANPDWLNFCIGYNSYVSMSQINPPDWEINLLMYSDWRLMHPYFESKHDDNQVWVTYKVWLPAGTYRITVISARGTSYGILKTYVDDVLKDTYDMYYASSIATVHSFTFAVTESKVCEIKLKIDGTSGSSYKANLYDPFYIGRIS